MPTLNEYARLTFKVSTSRNITAFPNRANRSIIRFTPERIIDGVVLDENGDFDFSNNSVYKVEVIANCQMIDSDSNDVTYSGSKLSVELGAFDIDSRNGLSIRVVVYLIGDTQGIVFCGEGLDANIYVTFQETAESTSSITI